MSEILCINTPSVCPTDFQMTFACSCGNDISFDIRTDDFKIPFTCLKCGQKYNQEDIEPFFRNGTRGILVLPPDMFKEVENNE